MSWWGWVSTRHLYVYTWRCSWEREFKRRNFRSKTSHHNLCHHLNPHITAILGGKFFRGKEIVTDCLHLDTCNVSIRLQLSFWTPIIAGYPKYTFFHFFYRLLSLESYSSQTDAFCKRWGWNKACDHYQTTPWWSLGCIKSPMVSQTSTYTGQLYFLSIF